MCMSLEWSMSLSWTCPESSCQPRWTTKQILFMTKSYSILWNERNKKKRNGFLRWLTGLKSLNEIKCYSRYLFNVQVESIQKLLFQVPLITLLLLSLLLHANQRSVGAGHSHSEEYQLFGKHLYYCMIVYLWNALPLQKLLSNHIHFELFCFSG